MLNASDTILLTEPDCSLIPFINSDSLITNINTVGSTIENTYKTKLDKLVTDNKEALAAVGITVDDKGKLSVDADKLKSADMSE